MRGDGFEAGVAFEIAGVIGEDSEDFVNVHGGGESGVLDLNAFHFVLYWQRTPLDVNLVAGW